MRLRSLTIQGFKTFVQRTSVEFDTGITAIVGPNGSGKSNLADAIRWTMGEQSIRALRGRRTEDVLFAGGRGRPPAGFAEVSLLFDATSPNGRPGLDLPFSEVSIARRAYRSGENEYFLNRDRVRLRDIADVFGQVGLDLDGFAVVGQGTVDSALSLRPSDRRALVEQAAGTGYLQSRLDESQNRLDQTRQNLERVSDLLAELTPRLRGLERQARLARERETVQQELWKLVLRWYAHRLSGPAGRIAHMLPELERARADEVAAGIAIEKHRHVLESTGQAAAATQKSFADLNAAQVAIRDRYSVLTRDISNDEQRLTLLAARRSELTAGVDHWRTALAEEQSGLDDFARRRTEVRAQLADVNSRLTEHARELNAWSEQHRDLVVRQLASRRRLGDAERALANASSKAQALDDRRIQLVSLLGACDERRRVLDADLAKNVAIVEATGESVKTACRAVVDVEEQRRLAESVQLDAIERLDAAAAVVTAIDRQIHAAKARVEAFDAAEASGSGYFPGVRAILRAAGGLARPPFTIVGVVSRLLAASADFELAIEVALGGRAQDIVVDRWSDAEAAITFLKTTNAGRATFLPLDVLRPINVSNPPQGPGIVGVGATLVETDPRLRVVCDFLLGQTLVVDDLTVARRILGQVSGGWQIVTRDGEVARTSGAVTGGAPPSTRGSLARHRELRDARRDLASLIARRPELSAILSARRGEVDRLIAAVADLQSQAAVREDHRRRVASELADSESRVRRLLDQKKWETNEFARVETDLAGIVGRSGEYAAQIETATQEHSSAEEATRLADKALERFSATTDDLDSAIRSGRSDRAVLSEQLAAFDREEQRMSSRTQSIGTRLSDHYRLLDEAGSDLAVVDERLDATRRHAALTSAELVDVDQKVERLREEVSRCRARLETAIAKQSRLDVEYRTASSLVREVARRIEEATVELQGFRQQLTLELGSPEEQTGDETSLTVVLPDGTRSSEPILLLSDSERVRDRIAALKARLKVLPSGTDSVAEFNALRERIDGLAAQSEDLNRTTGTLSSAIAETRSTMQTRFEATFADVSARFSQRFSDLFGGGTARLEVESDGDAAGVEVFVQPPGKRTQSLATLSGGERALTAAALLFSLIEANPPPFCVLDEVDAALDDSNVIRFAGCLRELAERTQFVVITHNRRTMEAATAIYGLTLENRCETRVLSMRLPDELNEQRSGLG